MNVMLMHNRRVAETQHGQQYGEQDCNCVSERAAWPRCQLLVCGMQVFSSLHTSQELGGSVGQVRDGRECGCRPKQ
jgi:hypothetical protein